tara:strand:- start:1622 stop:3955 length:2334 start_codon:yes stop_codon:yes gene_type:complete
MAKATIDLEKDKFNAQGEVKVSGSFGGGGKTDYSASDITALGSSNDINKWLAAYNDGMLTKEYVENFDFENEHIAYYTHPSLGDGNKSLRITYIYTGSAPNRRLFAEYPQVANWTFDAQSAGDLTLTLGTITSPAVDAAVGTDVCTVSIADSGPVVGTYTVSLTGTNASLYRLNNTTQSQTGSLLTVALTDTIVVETASTFTGVTYSHSFTVNFTETSVFRTESANVTTTGAANTSQNEFFLDGQSTSSSVDDFQLNATNKSLTPTYGGTTFPEIGTDDFSISMWLRITNNSTAVNTVIWSMKSSTDGEGIAIFLRNGGTPSIRLHLCSTLSNRVICNTNIPSATRNDWNHYTFVMPTGAISSSNHPQVSINGGTLQNHTVINDSGNFNAASLASKTISGSFFSARSYSSSNGTAGNRHTASTIDIDELAFYAKRLNQTECNAIYNNGNWHNLDNLTGYNLDRYFRMGDGPNDSVGNTQVFDIKNTSDYIEKVGSGTHGIAQLTMDDPIYSSSSGNHKYVEDAYRGPVTNSKLTGNYNRDSSADYLGFFPSLDSTTAFRSSPNVSYSFWFKPNSTGSTKRNLIFAEVYENASGNQDFFQMYTSKSPEELQATSAKDGTTRYHRIAQVNDDAWYHVVVTTNTDDVLGGATYYINGSAVTIISSSGTTITRSDPVEYIVFGGENLKAAATQGTNDAGGTSGNFEIDEFSTWKRTLNASEVLELFNGGVPGNLSSHSAATDLQRWLRWGDTTGDGVAIKDSQNTSWEVTSFDSQDNTTNH